MRYDLPNPYAGIRFDLLYGFKVQHNPNAILHHWAERELEEGLCWLTDEFRLQARELAVADDEGMGLTVSESEQ